MAKTNIKSIIQSDIDNVWETVLAVKNYNKWRSDVSKTESINEKKFIEYTKDGYSTTFTVTFIKPLNRWEFDMENSNMKGHWIGIFTSKDDKTEIDFTEQVSAKKFFMKPFVKSYLKKHQTQFVMDLKKILEK
ncbi:SRPBCC family protein [Merdimonas faecis]|uniref:SRPBCC family protein n=1 Tax=Merdimonas faecis TaxID=1653435 RepID=UPI0008637319|nr:SRPBCC family protein [Merdimonas faecis]